MRRLRKFLPVLVILVAVAAMIGLSMMKSPPPQREARPRIPLVEVIEVAERPAGFELRVQGTVQPRTQTTLVSEVAGTVLEVSDRFEAGGLFEKGELILRVDPKDYQVAVARAQAQLANRRALLEQEQARATQAAKDWRSIGKGEPTGLVLRKPYVAEAEANVHAAEADLRSARINLDRTTIRAPFDGLLREKRVDTGQFVATGTALGVLAAVDLAEVRLPLTEADLAVIDLPSGAGLPMRLEARGAGAIDSWPATLVRTEGVLDERTRVLHGVAQIEDPYRLRDPAGGAPLRFGSFVEAYIPGALSHPVIALPRHALRGMDEVLIADADDRLRLRTIRVLRTDAEHVYVASGLVAGERVIATVIEAPLDGMQVRVAGSEPDPTPAVDAEPAAPAAAAEN